MTTKPSTLIDELFATVEAIGVEETSQILKRAKLNQSYKSESITLEFILSSISVITGVPKKTILYGTERNDERKIALSLCIFYVKEELGYSFSDIKQVIKKSESALWKYNALVEQAPKKPKTEFEKKLVEFIKQLNLLITEKKLRNGKD